MKTVRKEGFKMKKIIALLLALMMLLSFTAIVSADGTLHSSDEVDAALKLDSYEITSAKKAGPYGSDTNLFDKNISTASTGSGATKWQVNWAFCETGDSITFNISSENAIAFSGVRFYSLRVDSPTDGSYGLRGEQRPAKIYVSVSADGENYVKTDLLQETRSGVQEGFENNRWNQFALSFGGDTASVSGIKYIKLEVTATGGEEHFGVDEITLLNPDGENTKTIAQLRTASFVAKAAELDSYLVNGGLERKAILDELDGLIKSLTDDEKASIKDSVEKYNTAKTRYAAARQEIDTTGKLTAESAISYKGDGNINNTLNASKLTDGSITKEGQSGKVNGVDTFCRGDFCVDPSDNAYNVADGRHTLITLTLDPTVEFSGIRSYTGKYDDTTGSTSWYTAKKVLVTLYDADGNKIAFGGISPVLAKTANGERDNSYADYVIAENGTEYSVTGVSKIEFDILKLEGKEQHWRAEEFRLLTATGEAKTVAEIKGEMLASEAAAVIAAINAIDSRVTGSVEQKKGIAAARAAYDALSSDAAVNVTNYSTLTTAEAAYNGESVKEIEASLTGSAYSDHRASHDHSDYGYNKGGNDTGIYSTANLLDNKISAESVIGSKSSFMRGDYTVFGKVNEYLYITINTDGVGEFSGIRLYNRKQDNNTDYSNGNIPSKVKVALYSSDTVYVSTGIVVPTVKAGTNGKENMYYDIPLTFNGETVKFTGITKVVVTLTEMTGDNKWGAFGAEELRLLDDETVTATKTVSDVAKTLVTLSTPTFESGVYGDGTGIIRFFTTFDAIADGVEIESFGTYAHVNSVSENMNDKCATYEGKTPAVNDNFSVDVTGITEGYFDKPVFALSFVKIKGYDNLILSEISTGATVNTGNKLK